MGAWQTRIGRIAQPLGSIEIDAPVEPEPWARPELSEVGRWARWVLWWALVAQVP